MRFIAIFGIILIALGLLGLIVTAILPSDNFVIPEQEIIQVDNINDDKGIDSNQVVANTEEVVVPKLTSTLQSTTTKSNISQTPNDFLRHEVAFASQAPFGLWDELHQEACEEASMIMVKKYFNKESLNAHAMDQEIYNLIDWETANDYKVDLTTTEVKQILDQYFNLDSTVFVDVTADNIISEIDKGNLVIIPALGRNLANPYFTQPGPIYHMLVVIGYDKNKKEFITNDPGTKNGKSFRYSYSNLISSIADWNHDLAKDGMTEQELRSSPKAFVSVSGELKE